MRVGGGGGWWGFCPKYLNSGWNRKEGKGNKDLKKRGVNSPEQPAELTQK